jgi:TolB-like protein
LDLPQSDPPPWENSPIRKIAVLPLENLSGDAQQEYFADGMTDAIIDQLARVRGLTVISRTSTMQYKKARKPLPQIARDLGVNKVVAGTVLHFGNRVRVSAQLIDAASDRHLLSRTFEQDMEECLEATAGCRARYRRTDQEQLDCRG